ncbi:Gfo/Idh/MocA family oxidoreductase [Ignavibacteria bacterium 4148-Me]|uniref:Gfo/Idh/MocA family oxidoreductase n=1 Tax=Rosettibacter primus TaxID=3111523 RepID=UPI00336BF395
MFNFAITGVAGYIAPKHLQAIKDTGNNLVAALDPHDSVGILDQYFPNASFFVEFERFERHLDLLRRKSDSERVHYLSICSPNFLHDSHIRLALRIGADAICEKPIVLNPWNLDALEKIEIETGKKVYTILQLRVHPTIIELKNKIAEAIRKNPNAKFNIKLDYITSRGLWYDFSWKGVIEKSGGVATNIGIHFFDMLIWIFGEPVHSIIIENQKRSMRGELELKHASVNWHLSINYEDLPDEIKKMNKRTYRSIKINEEELEFTEGFTNLHTVVYRNILSGNGYGITDARPSIELVYKIRNGINF